MQAKHLTVASILPAWAKLRVAAWLCRKASPAFDPLPSRSSKKASAKGKRFNPLPDRTCHEKEKQKDASAQTAHQPQDQQSAQAMEQNFARLMQELDLGECGPCELPSSDFTC